MKPKLKSLEKSDRGFDAKTFWRHYVATVDTDQDWNQEPPPQGRASSRLFLFLLLFHVFLIGSVVLFNLVSERPKPVFVDSSAPMKTVIAKKFPDAAGQAPATGIIAGKEAETIEHRVAQGDSLKSIADASGATQEEIAKMNQIDVTTQLAVGSVLRVPKPKAKPAPTAIPVGLQPSRVGEKLVVVQATTAPTNTTMFAAVEPAPAPKKVEIVPPPKKTETVASKLPEEKPKPKVEDSPPSAPKPKAAAKVEETSPAAKAKSTESKAIARNEAASTPKAKASEPPKSAEPATSKPAVATKTHTVKPGETFYSISRKYGVKVGDLMRINNVTDPGKLREGIVLKMPK